MRLCFARAVALVSLAVAFGVPGEMYAAALPYSTSFESPVYSTGLLSGQDGWFGFALSTPMVENSFADSGSQAVVVNGGTTSQTGAYHFDVSSGPLIDLSADIAIFSSSTQSEWQFAGIVPSFLGFLGGIDILPDNSIVAITAGFPVIGTFNRANAFSPAAWNNVNFLFDIATQTYSISINGVTLDSDVPFCNDTSTCTSGQASTSYAIGMFDSFGTGNDVGYLDNYSVALGAPVPEPSSALPLLGMLLVGIATVLKQRASTGN